MDIGNQDSRGTGEIREVTEEKPLDPSRETLLTQEIADYYRQFPAQQRVEIWNRQQRRLASKSLKTRSKRKRRARR